MARRRGFAPLCALVAFAMLSGASAAGLRQIPAAYETQRLAPAGQEAGSAAPPEAGSGNNFHQMKEVAQNDPRSAMEMLKSAARDIRAKFHEAQKSPKFGIGMRRRTVRRIAQESEEFWDFLENIDKVQDVDSWTSSDAEDLQILIAQVAQMDDDLSDPATTNRAKKEYRAIVREFKNSGIMPGL